MYQIRCQCEKKRSNFKENQFLTVTIDKSRKTKNKAHSAQYSSSMTVTSFISVNNQIYSKWVEAFSKLFNWIFHRFSEGNEKILEKIIFNTIFCGSTTLIPHFRQYFLSSFKDFIFSNIGTLNHSNESFHRNKYFKKLSANLRRIGKLIKSMNILEEIPSNEVLSLGASKYGQYLSMQQQIDPDFSEVILSEVAFLELCKSFLHLVCFSRKNNHWRAKEIFGEWNCDFNDILELSNKSIADNLSFCYLNKIEILKEGTHLLVSVDGSDNYSSGVLKSNPERNTGTSSYLVGFFDNKQDILLSAERLLLNSVDSSLFLDSLKIPIANSFYSPACLLSSSTYITLMRLCGIDYDRQQISISRFVILCKELMKRLINRETASLKKISSEGKQKSDFFKNSVGVNRLIGLKIGLNSLKISGSFINRKISPQCTIKVMCGTKTTLFSSDCAILHSYGKRLLINIMDHQFCVEVNKVLIAVSNINFLIFIV
jgi:hypothetical protein